MILIEEIQNFNFVEFHVQRKESMSILTSILLEQLRTLTRAKDIARARVRIHSQEMEQGLEAKL